MVAQPNRRRVRFRFLSGESFCHPDAATSLGTELQVWCRGPQKNLQRLWDHPILRLFPWGSSVLVPEPVRIVVLSRCFSQSFAHKLLALQFIGR